MLERILQVRGVERREWNVLTEFRWYRRPVVGKRDVRSRGSRVVYVVTPNPAAECQCPVACGVLARLPGDRVRAVEHDHLVGHLVVLGGVVVVIHRDPEDLAVTRQRLAVEGVSHPAGPVDGGMSRGVCEYAEYCFGRCGDRNGGGDGVVGHALQTAPGRRSHHEYRKLPLWRTRRNSNVTFSFCSSRMPSQPWSRHGILHSPAQRQDTASPAR